MKDYRVDMKDETQLKTALYETRHAPHHLYGFVRYGLPLDRRGLIAVLHDRIMTIGGTLFWNEMAAEIAQKTGQRVYVVMTASRWHLLLFGIVDDPEHPDGWYDEHEGGKYANDQYIAHYDPDGTFHFDGAS